MVDPLQPTVDVPFHCEISRTLRVRAHRGPMLYGHGLLGDRSEVGGRSTERLRERGWSPCAVDWWGMSFADLPNVAATPRSTSAASRASPTASSRASSTSCSSAAPSPTPTGFDVAPAFRGPDGEPLVRAGDLAYDGNSQGGIMGGALTALAPDFRRAVLGVPGMAYSTLLNRSVDWEGEYAVVYEAAYPDPIDRQLGYALMQMLWDRGRVGRLRPPHDRRPAARHAAHEVFLQVAFADHQVANVAAEVDGPHRRRVARHPRARPGPALGDRSDLRVPHRPAATATTPARCSSTGTPPAPGCGPRPTATSRRRRAATPTARPAAYGPATDQVSEWLLPRPHPRRVRRGPVHDPRPAHP